MRPNGRIVRRSSALATILVLVVTTTALGVSWSSAVAISASGNAYAEYESTTVTGTQRVHQFYTENDSASSQAWYRQSADGGSTWGTPKLISHGAAYAAAAGSINGSGLVLDLVWWEWDASNNYRIWYRHSLDAGVSWSTSLALTPAVGDAGKPDVARSGDRVTVAYTDGANGKVYVRISTNGGATFGTKQSVGTTTNQPFLPDATSFDAWSSVGDSAGTITVAWNSSANAINVRRSTDGGANWHPVVNLATNAVGGWVSLTTASARIVIGYTSLVSGQYRATQRHSGNEGVGWSAAGLIGGLRSFVPVFAYGGGVLRTAYERCNIDCSTSATYFRTSSDFGGTWSAESQASRSVHQPYAWAIGLGVIASSQTVVVYGHYDGLGYYLYARKTV